MRELILEGPTDEAFVRSFIKARKLPIEFRDEEYYPSGGHDNAIKTLGLRLKLENHNVIGLIIDADFEGVLAGYKEKIRECFTQNGLVPPNLDGIGPKGNGKGLVYTDIPNLRFGIWVMPDNKSEGTLESLAQYFIPKRNEDKRFLHAKTFVKEACDQKIAKLTAAQIPKAELHAWLSIQELPGLSVAEAIQYRYLKSDQLPEAAHFATWLKDMFGA